MTVHCTVGKRKRSTESKCQTTFWFIGKQRRFIKTPNYRYRFLL